MSFEGSLLLRVIEAEVLTDLDGKHARALYESLKPEIMETSRIGRSELSLTKEGLFFTICTVDVSKMRAVIGSYLRLVKVALKTLDLVEQIG